MSEEDAKLRPEADEEQNYLMQLMTAVSSELITEEIQKE